MASSLEKKKNLYLITVFTASIGIWWKNAEKSFKHYHITERFIKADLYLRRGKRHKTPSAAELLVQHQPVSPLRG